MNPIALEVSPTEDIDVRLDILRELNISSVGVGEMYPEWYFKGPATYLPVSDVGRRIRQRRMNVVTVHGVGGFVSPDPAQQDEVLQHLKSEVDRAAEWGSPVIVFHFRQPAMAWALSEMAVWTMTITEYGLEKYDSVFVGTAAALCAHAERRGVTVHLEGMGPPYSFGHCVEQMIPILRAVKHNRLGICVDSGHMHCSGHDPAEQILRAKGFPLTLHLNDNLGPMPPNYDIYDGDLHLVPGFGTINWPKLNLALRHIHYAGAFFFEGPHINNADYKECVELTLRNRRIYEELANVLGTKWMIV